MEEEHVFGAYVVDGRVGEEVPQLLCQDSLIKALFLYEDCWWVFEFQGDEVLSTLSGVFDAIVRRQVLSIKSNNVIPDSFRIEYHLNRCSSCIPWEIKAEIVIRLRLIGS